MSLNKILEKFTLIFFFGFIFIIPIITLSTKDKVISEVENKILTPLPKLNLDTIKDKTFMNNFDKYSADQFPIREKFIQLKNSYSYSIGTREFRDIYIGKDNRLMEKFVVNKTILDKNISQATKLSYHLYEKYKIKSTLMIIPTSIAFYENELPSFAITDNQKYTLNYINNKISNDSSFISFYTSYDILNKYKDMAIYFNTDHHWTQLGARLAYEDMYNNIASLESFINNNYNKVSDDFYGTYYSKVILPNIKYDSIYAFEDFNNFNIEIDFDKKFNTLYSPDKLNGKNKYQYFLHGDPAFAVIDGNSNVSDEILIFKDSYAHNFIPFLTSNYNKIHVVDPRYYNIDIDDYITKNKEINEILFINNIQTFNSMDIYKAFKY